MRKAHSPVEQACSPYTIRRFTFGNGRLRSDADRDCKTPCLDFPVQKVDKLSVQLLFHCIRVSFNKVLITQQMHGGSPHSSGLVLYQTPRASWLWFDYNMENWSEQAFRLSTEPCVQYVGKLWIDCGKGWISHCMEAGKLCTNLSTKSNDHQLCAKNFFGQISRFGTGTLRVEKPSK